MALNIPVPTIERPRFDAKPVPASLTPRFRAVVRATHRVLKRRLESAAIGDRILVARDLESGESLSVSAWHNGPSIRLEIEQDCETVAGIDRMYPRALLEIPSYRLAEAIVTDLDLLLAAMAARTEPFLDEAVSRVPASPHRLHPVRSIRLGN